MFPSCNSDDDDDVKKEITTATVAPSLFIHPSVVEGGESVFLCFK